MMRNFILLAVVVAALVWFGRNYAPQSKAPQARAAGESVSRGAVDDVRRQPDAVMDMGNAMSGGGTSSKAMLDTARGASR
jgi:hypothetical protein